MSKYGDYALAAGFAAVMMTWAYFFGTSLRDRHDYMEGLVHQCQNAGHAEYECRSLKFHTP